MTPSVCLSIQGEDLVLFNKFTFVHIANFAIHKLNQTIGLFDHSLKVSGQADGAYQKVKSFCWMPWADFEGLGYYGG